VACGDLAILVIDRDDGFRSALAGTLMEDGHRVVEANLPVALPLDPALADVSVVIADHPPGESSLDFADRLVRAHPGLRLILTTAHWTEHLAAQAARRTNVSLLRKPFSYEGVHDLVHCLGARRPAARLPRRATRMKEGTEKLLGKARRALCNADAALRAGSVDRAAGSAYYAMLHAAQALLNELGLRPHSHAAVHEALRSRLTASGLLDEELHLWLVEAHARRATEIDLAETEAERLVERARQFVAVAEAWVAAGKGRITRAGERHGPSEG
jgi:uncharacterized protein (UPF0332 family)